MPGAAPVPGLASAWRWSPNPVFTFTAALSTDGRPNLQVNVRGSYDEALVPELELLDGAPGVSSSGRTGTVPSGGRTAPVPESS
ncbi:hypothetical protein [Streptomyces pseudogriseolus]|uniref:hypothetical protein n=1 Tax=Streptomyces pseudogriseolus TaxID=36817 RepID=UPI003FA1EBCA